ncbi:MAG TPA: carboxypeptidase regulatory-like domain-containing protein [Rhodospirillales bacterium]|nr:carboxypeptidase regulatory-like domain-containing protein [Rhodospirillales bacterium]
MKKVLVVLMALIVSIAFAGTSFAAKKKKGYVEGTAGAGSITGVVSLKGNTPAPIMEDLSKGKNVEFCITHPDAKGNIRARVKVTTAGGKLKDTVVFIEKIETGKPWGDLGKAHFDFKKCDIVQKVLAVRKPSKAEAKANGTKAEGGVMTVTNNDPEILHNPHGYSIAGANRKTLFNKPLPSQGDIARVTKNIKRLKQKKDKHFFLQCDQHNFMEADARIVWNPYYSITGADGVFKIDGIPAGKYRVTAWHPYAGESSQDVTVGAGAAKANFTLVAKKLKASPPPDK